MIARQQRAVTGLNAVLQRPSLDDAHFKELTAAIEEADTVGVNVVEARAWLQKLKNQKSLEDEARAVNAANKAAAAAASPPAKSPPAKSPPAKGAVATPETSNVKEPPVNANAAPAPAPTPTPTPTPTLPGVGVG